MNPRKVLAVRRRAMQAGACRAAGVLAAAVLAGCTGGPPGVPHRVVAPRPAVAVPAGAVAAGSRVRVPVPDFASPASVAAAFYVAWASADAVHDGPGAFAVRCAPLVTAPLEAQLAASQPPAAEWDAMRRSRTVSLVRVQAVIHPEGAPDPVREAAYLRVYAVRITTSAAGHTAAPDGITVELTRTGRRWLVSRLLFF